MARYTWPGNVRLTVAEAAVDATTGDTLADAERSHIFAALAAAKGKVGGANGAAARLGMKRTTLQSKMKKLGIATD